MNLNPEEQEVMVRARAYQEMVQSSGWKRITQFLNLHTDQAKETLRKSQSSDDKVNGNLQRRWKEREDTVDAIQLEISSALIERDELVKGILVAQGATDEQVEQISEKEEVMYG